MNQFPFPYIPTQGIPMPQPQPRPESNIHQEIENLKQEINNLKKRVSKLEQPQNDYLKKEEGMYMI